MLARTLAVFGCVGALALKEADSNGQPPADWVERIGSGKMLWTANDEHPPGFKPNSEWGRHASVANGVVGSIIDSGILFLAGVFNGPDLANNSFYPADFTHAGARSHLARIPSNMAVRIAGGVVIACALDLERAVYIRRSNVTAANVSAIVEQRWYAHRTRKSVVVMELGLHRDISNRSDEVGGEITVGIDAYQVGNETDLDVVWTNSSCPATEDEVWCRDGYTKQAENGSVPGPHRVAVVSSPLPSQLTLSANRSLYFFTVADSSVMSTSTNISIAARALAVHRSLIGMSAVEKAQLLQSHATQWGELWKLATLEIDNDDDDARSYASSSYSGNSYSVDFWKRTVNATLYGMLSLHDETDTVPYPGSPLDGITLGAFGHWGGCYLWDADVWMYPALALWRPDFMAKLLQYRADRLSGARRNAKRSGHAGAKIPGNITILGQNEIHQGGDIVFELQQHWWQIGGGRNHSRLNQSGQTHALAHQSLQQFQQQQKQQQKQQQQQQWLQTVALPLATGVAEYYADRVVARRSASPYPNAHSTNSSISDQPPLKQQQQQQQYHLDDEHHSAVNDSGYDIAVAVTALRFAAELVTANRSIARSLSQRMAQRVALGSRGGEGAPDSEYAQPHPSSREFEEGAGEVDSYPVSSANVTRWLDVADGLSLSLPYDAQRGYHPEYEGMQQKGFTAKQADTLMMQYPLMFRLFNCTYQNFNFPPYFTWSEKAGGTGNVPYLTSGGGFLQVLQYGYVGVRVLSDRMRIRRSYRRARNGACLMPCCLSWLMEDGLATGVFL